MPGISRLLFLLAGVSLATATVLSAYGVHGLAGKVPQATLASWQWANQFQFLHSLGLIVIGLLLHFDRDSRLLRGAAVAMCAGLLLFCGSIYAKTLGAPAALGEITPLGGSAFMLAWLLTGIGGLRMKGPA